VGELDLTHLDKHDYLCPSVRDGIANAERSLTKNEINKLRFECYDYCGESRLHIDAITGSTEFVKLLVNHGAHIDIVQPKVGETPFHTSIVYRHKNTAAYLILQKKRRNIHVIAVFAFGMDRLDFVNKYKKKFLVLLKAADVDTNKIESYYRTCFNYACARGDTEVAKLLLHCGLEVGVDFTDFYYTRALSAAARNGHKDTIEFLVKLGSDINACKKSSEKDQPPLSITAAKERQDGADVNLMGGKCSPLDYAKERLDFLLYTRGNSNDNLTGDDEECDYIFEDDVEYIIARRAIKMEEPYLDNLVRDVFDQYELECYGELRRMKLKKFKNMDLTFYDIMKKSDQTIVKLMRNENVVEAYKSEGYKSEFPFYARMLTGRFYEALDECELHDNAHQALMFLFKNLPELPIECIEKICNNLLEGDLWWLASDKFQSSFSTV